MNKKIIAIAIASAMAAPVAMADTSVYGRAQIELGDFGAGTAASKTTLKDNKNTRFGIKFSEDLGNGMKALGQFEFGLDLLDGQVKTNKSGIYARNSAVGLSGSFGKVMMGTVKQPYKYSGGVMYDAFVATGAEARSNNGGMLSTHFAHGGYFANAISWQKKFNNVKVWLATSLDEGADVGNTYVGRDGDVMASVVVGIGKSAEVGVAVASDDITGGATVGAAGEENTKIFGKWSSGAHKVVAQVEAMDKPGTASDVDVMFLGYTMKMGKNSFVVQVGNTDATGTANDVDYTAIGMFHNLSKKTRVFAAIRDTDSKTNANDEEATTIGLDVKF